MKCTLQFTVFLVVVTVCFGNKAPKVKISNGELQGVHLKSRDGKTYSAFKGIPYAKPPTRFKVAEPAKSWEGIRDASKFGSVCVQKPMFDVLQLYGESIMGTEDCLFLNVYSHKLDGNLPVMVFIHGGAFMIGSADDSTGTYFMDEDVVFVAINYRLGAFGFLSTGDEAVEPNLGLKDQNLALKWVQKNIHAFGGDRNRITIFGESAGSASVHYQVLSPMSKGLFNGAILQSGTALNPWAFTENPMSFASVLGKSVGCPTDSSQELITCLKEKTAEEIASATLTEWHVDPAVAFPPTLDIVGKSEQIFLPDKPINILNSGMFNKVPLIFTACEHEGMLLHSFAINSTENLRSDINEDYERILPISLMFKHDGYSESEQKRISREIKEFYFGDNEIGGSTFQDLTNLYSDGYFIAGIEKSMSLHAKHVAVYNGIFAYQAQTSLMTILFQLPQSPGVTHGDDILFFFGSDTSFMYPPNTKDEMASKYFVSLWANFATTGNPGLNWAKVTWDPINEMDLKKNGPRWFNLDFPPTILENPYKERTEFWENVMKKDVKEEL